MTSRSIHSLPPTQTSTPTLKGYVRKAEASEVLIQGWRSVSAETQIVALQWPAAHEFYSQPTGATSHLLLTECARQSLALLSNTVHGIPLNHRLGWEYARTTVDQAALRPRSLAATAELTVTHSDITRRRGGSVQLRARITATLAGEHLGTAEIHYSTHPPAIYNRLRRQYADAERAFANALPPAPPEDPAAVGRDSARDVVIAPTGTPHEWQLRTDTTHTVLFDHPHDHVPGMVLLEAVSQVTQTELGREDRVTPVDIDSTFLRYVEFDAPVYLTGSAQPSDLRGRPRIRVSGKQNGQEVFHAFVTCERAAAPVVPMPRAV